MQYDVQTPEEYMQALDHDWRRDTLEELRALIHQHGPDLVEDIAYKMLRYSDAEEGIFGLNAQKHYVSLYVGDIKKIDPDGSLLKGLNMGKGCIRFSKTKVVSETGIEEFITRTIDMSRKGKDIDC